MRSTTTGPTAVTTIRSSLWPLVVGLAVATVVVACIEWSRATPGPGHRPFAAIQAWTARSAAIGLWAAAHAGLFGVALPGIYGVRPVYAGLAALCGLTAAFAGVTWAALLLAGV